MGSNTRETIAVIVEGLESLRDQARESVESLQQDDVIDPSIDVDDVFDNTLDILNALDHELKEG